jgi:predicted MFS family arabinose efflux permease
MCQRVESLFYVTLILALVSIFVLIKLVPNPPHITHTYKEKAKLGEILGNPNLIKMNITNFLQKGLMTFAFMIIPITLMKHFNWEMSELWKVYLPAMILGIFAMAPAAIIAEKKGKFREILLVGIILFGVSYLLIGFSSNATIFVIGVVIFFIGFNMHEPIMQSLAAKFAKVHQRGLVLGIFTSAGYVGTFLGGLLGGAFELNPISRYETPKRIIPTSKISLNFPFFSAIIAAGAIAKIPKIIAGR